ncbi:MAG: hypothetical protein WBV89_06090, partial [Ilumatobacter sp.]
MKKSVEAPWSRLRSAADGRVTVGIVIVLGTILVLPSALWLIVLAAAMASRPLSGPLPNAPERAALRQWIAVSAVFVGAVLVSMVGKPLTSHGIQLLIWFTLLPAIAVLFWYSRRRSYTSAALWLGATIGASGAGFIAIVQVVLLGNPRAEGIVGNAITFGNLALVMGAVSLSLHRVTALPRRVAVSASLCAAGLGLTASILSGARGGWLVVPALIAVLLWQARSELTPVRVACLAIGLVGVIGFADVASGGMPTTRASASVTNVSSYTP